MRYQWFCESFEKLKPENRQFEGQDRDKSYQYPLSENGSKNPQICYRTINW